MSEELDDMKIEELEDELNRTKIVLAEANAKVQEFEKEPNKYYEMQIS